MNARAALVEHQFQIIFLPAGNERTPMVRGYAPHNLYVEEPGVPASELKYADEFARDEVVRDAEGRRHLRVNPGFGRAEFGMAPARPFASSTTRTELLQFFKSVDVPVDPAMASARWGTTYYHSQRGLNAELYLLSALSSLLETKKPRPIVVFDFGSPHFAREPFLDWRSSRISRWLGRGIDSQELKFGAKHRWVGRDSRRSLTIVRVGRVPPDLYGQVVHHADIPIAVTGTQSLNEAIAARIPFVYEFISWKMDLVFGMAEAIVQNFEGPERTFLLDWIAGEGDTLNSIEDVDRARTAYLTSSTTRTMDQIKRHTAAVRELMDAPDRRVLVQKLTSALGTRYDLVTRLQSCALRLTDG